MKVIYFYPLVLALCLFSSCKQKKKSSGGSTGPTNVDTRSQQDQLIDPLNQTATGARITVNGQGTGETISLRSFDLDSLGGVPVVIENLNSNSIAVGVLSPTGVQLQSSSGQYSLRGSLPSGATSSTIVILVRDLTKCGTDPDCNITPDSSGRFSTQIQRNSQADLVGEFNVVLADNTNNNNNNNPNNNNFNNGSGIGNSFQNFLRNPFVTIGNGARQFWDYLRSKFY